MTHPELVSALCKSGYEIATGLAGFEAHQLHMVLGLAGEVGELIDCVKRAAIYKQPMDVQNAIEELGDIEFYLEGLRQGLHVSREVCLENNIAKLSMRYGKTYSNSAAKERKDKQ